MVPHEYEWTYSILSRLHSGPNRLEYWIRVNYRELGSLSNAAALVMRADGAETRQEFRILPLDAARELRNRTAAANLPFGSSDVYGSCDDSDVEFVHTLTFSVDQHVARWSGWTQFQGFDECNPALMELLTSLLKLGQPAVCNSYGVLAE